MDNDNKNNIEEEKCGCNIIKDGKFKNHNITDLFRKYKDNIKDMRILDE